MTEDQIQTLNDNGKLTQADIENIKAGIRKLTYEDFYARGDGVSNDYLFSKRIIIWILISLIANCIITHRIVTHSIICIIV